MEEDMMMKKMIPKRGNTTYEKLGLAIIIIMAASLVFILAFSGQLNGLRPVLEARNLDPHLLQKEMKNLGKVELAVMISMGAFLFLVVGFSVFFSSSARIRPAFGGRSLDSGLREDVSDGEVVKDDLLPTGFDEESCRSRHESLLYRRRPHVPASPHLISKLRSYEARHKRCGPGTEPFKKSVEFLKAGANSSSDNDSGCKYMVWLPMHGLGNRMLTLASTFLYALLTDRVLLVDRGIDSRELFCEPFPGASWLLPSDFPVADEFRGLHQRSPRCYGEMLKRQKQSNSSALLLPQQPYVFLNLAVDFDDDDKHVFCDEDQSYLQKIPWLVARSNVYFVPSFFLMPMFQEVLDGLFPNKETVFHLLGRYLLHPTNTVWGLITRYHDSYLSKADVTIGIQIRIFDTSATGLPQHLLEQIESCTSRENILPEIIHDGGLGPDSNTNKKKKRVAVVMTSLASGYYEGVRDLYWENPTTTGDVVAVFQPSHEMFEQNEKTDHNRKALAEIYLLSLADEVVTSSYSTFGYVAQGLAGVRPWILDVPRNDTTPEPPCKRGTSMEPCNHGAPRYNVCKSREAVDVPFVRGCEDRFWDKKLFPN